MTELLLNLLWFGLAAGALVAYVRATAARNRQFPLGLGALLCISALLLPAISITDDLHSDACAIEDSSCTKRLAKADVHASPVSQLVWFAVSLPTALFSVPRRLTSLSVLSAFDSRPHSAFYPPVLGRAPPCRLSLSGVYAA